MGNAVGFAQPLDALLKVRVHLADFTIMNEAGNSALSPTVFVGDQGAGDSLDCCVDGKPLLKIESAGEYPPEGPVGLSKQGCMALTMGIRVQFLTCSRSMTKSGQVITDPTKLEYTTVIQDARWRVVEILRCSRDPFLSFVSSTPVPTDGKCSGFTVMLTAKLALCGNCSPASS